MKKRIKLSESQLNRVIKESVKNILTELDWRTARAASNAAAKKLNNSDDKYERDRRFYQLAKFDEYANKRYNTQYGFPEDLKDDWEERNNVAYKMKNSKDWEYNPETNKARPLDDEGKPIDYKWWQNVPQEFYPTQGQLKKLSQRDKDIKDFNNGNSEYRSGKW